MTHVPVVRRMLVPALLLSTLLLSPLSAVCTDDPELPGILWQNSSQASMEMPGIPPMQMPANSVTVCAPVEWTGPPASGEQERGCVSSDFQRDGLKVTWTSVCAGPPEMTGAGEITFADESGAAYSGTIRYASEEGALVVNLTGKRLEEGCANPR